MFAWLRKIFGKKQQPEEPTPAAAATAQKQAPVEDVPEREIEETPQQRLEKMVKKEKELGTDPKRTEKTCPKCSAPNDEFVEICWMCKERI